jgi:hypothetical protein
MEEFELLKKLERVKAPPNFEQKVMTQLSLRKERKSRRLRYLRLSFAGAAAALVVAFISVSVFVLQKKGPAELAQVQKEISPAFQKEEALSQREVMPIIESVDYSGEVRSISYEPETIYILEQVSDVVYKEIKY